MNTKPDQPVNYSKIVSIKIDGYGEKSSGKSISSYSSRCFHSSNQAIGLYLNQSSLFVKFILNLASFSDLHNLQPLNKQKHPFSIKLIANQEWNYTGVVSSCNCCMTIEKLSYWRLKLQKDSVAPSTILH